jgi:dephospho-CoA kinase
VTSQNIPFIKIRSQYEICQNNRFPQVLSIDPWMTPTNSSCFSIQYQGSSDEWIMIGAWSAKAQIALAVAFILLPVSGWTQSENRFQPVKIGSLPPLTMSNGHNSVRVVKVLGVCGGIGSGKSAACKLLISDLDCLTHIDSDSIAHSVYEPNSDAIKDVVSEFGTELLNDGEIDRKKLGSIVFAHSAAMQRLERVVWPHVQSKIKAQIQKAKSEWKEEDGRNPIIVVEAAVLLDAGWQDFLDGVWVVSTSPQIALDRIQENRGLSAQEAEKRIVAQQSRRGIGNLEDELAANVVTAVIDNTGSLEDLKQRLHEKLHDPNAWYQRTVSPMS